MNGLQFAITINAMTDLKPTLKGSRGLSLSWSYLNELASGKSAIDLNSLALRNIEDARRFAREYGFDLNNPDELAQVRDAHREAVQFIESTFLEAHTADLIPLEVADPVDVLQLLVFASRHVLQPELRRLWSCAVLKVMHCVFYIDNNLKLRHFDASRRQIFESLDGLLKVEGDQTYLTDGDLCLPVLMCEKKSNKGRRSIILKLLQKVEYVAADIYDHLGMRLVFNTRFECLLALRILQRAHLISAINVEPQRTRNNLVDMLLARQIFARHRAQIARFDGYPHELLQRMDAELIALSADRSREDNPHSAGDYHSMQVTVRKMIRLPAAIDATSAATAAPSDAATGVKFFFEYEIQLLDRASYAQSQDGPASHGAYKQRQIETAKRRVMGAELLAWLRERKESNGPLR